MPRTKTAPDTTTSPTVEAPPDPPTQETARPSPVLAWPSEWPVPELPTPKQRRPRGLPMAPVLAGAGNTTALTATAAYSAGGPVAAAATGVVIVAGATAAVMRRRATVRATRATTAGMRASSGSGTRSGLGSGSSRGGGGSRRSGGSGRSGSAARPGSATRGALWRSGSGSSAAGARGAAGSGRRSSRGGLLSKSSRGHSPKHGRRDSGSGKHPRKQDTATKNTGRRAWKQAAKTLTAKTPTTQAGKRGITHGIKAAAGRAARATYQAARPHTARAKQAAARHTRRAGGALVDGLCALAAGGWTLLRRGRQAALDRLKTVWKRRRKDRAQPDTPDTPAVADTVRRPTTPITPSTGGPAMPGGGHHFVAAAAEMARAAAAYQPSGMLQVGQDFAGLEEALRVHAEALKTTVENADANWPLHPSIVEIMRQIHGLQLKAAELATELQPAFRKLHDVDIARLENPRQGERMWDVSANNA